MAVLPEYSYALKSLTKFSCTVNLRSAAFIRVDKDPGS